MKVFKKVFLMFFSLLLIFHLGFNSILFAENIREYQVFQINSNLLEIAILNINNEQEKLVKKEFDKLFDSLDIENVEIRFIDYKTDSTKKLKRIVRKVIE